MTQVIPKRSKQRGLKVKHQAFVREFVRTGNAAKAYNFAGFNTTTAMSAANCASQLLKRPYIQAAVQELIDKLDRKAINDMASEWRKTRKIRRSVAYQDPADLIDPATNKVKDIHDIPKKARRAIAGIRVNKDGEVELRLRDSHPHLTALEDRYAIMPDTQKKPTKVEISGSLQLNTVAEVDKAIEALLLEIKARETLEEAPEDQVNMLPAHESPSHEVVATSRNGSH